MWMLETPPRRVNGTVVLLRQTDISFLSSGKERIISQVLSISPGNRQQIILSFRDIEFQVPKHSKSVRWASWIQ